MVHDNVLYLLPRFNYLDCSTCRLESRQHCLNLLCYISDNMIVSRFIEVYGHCWLTESRQESMFNEHLERSMENRVLVISFISKHMRFHVFRKCPKEKINPNIYTFLFDVALDLLPCAKDFRELSIPCGRNRSKLISSPAVERSHRSARAPSEIVNPRFTQSRFVTVSRTSATYTPWDRNYPNDGRGLFIMP